MAEKSKYLDAEKVYQCIKASPLIPSHAKGALFEDLQAGAACGVDLRPVVQGKWVNDHNGRYSPLGDNFFCSVCKEPSLRAYGKPAKTRFCQNCGADMRGEADG